MPLTRIQPAAIADTRGVNFRNIIINGDMSIAQRGTSFTGLGNGDSQYTLDRFKFDEAGATTGELTISQSTDVPSGQGFRKSIKFDCTTADATLASDDLVYFNQRIEGQNVQYLNYGTSSAKKLALSFWVKSNISGSVFSTVLYNEDNTRIVNTNFSLNAANTWEKKTFIIDGDTASGFNDDTGKSLWLSFNIAVGSSWKDGSPSTTWTDYLASGSENSNWGAGSEANFLSSTSNELYITGIQLEVDAVTDFEFIPFDVNLERCARYFQKSYNLTVNPGTSTTTGMISTARIVSTVTNRPVNVKFRPKMRATPSITIYSLVGTQGSVSDVGTGTGHIRDEASSVSSSGEGGFAYIVGVSGLTAGDGFCFHYTAAAEL